MRPRAPRGVRPARVQQAAARDRSSLTAGRPRPSGSTLLLTLETAAATVSSTDTAMQTATLHGRTTLTQETGTT